jgi:hypothetical protein
MGVQDQAEQKQVHDCYERFHSFLLMVHISSSALAKRGPLANTTRIQSFLALLLATWQKKSRPSWDPL